VNDDDRLHDALQTWVSSPGEHAALSRLAMAAFDHPDPAVKAAGFRIRARRCRASDFWQIAAHDRQSEWRSIARLCDPEVGDTTTIADAIAGGLLRRDDAGFTAPRARVTRRAKSVSVGLEHDGGQTLAPALCTWDCSAGLSWPDAAAESVRENVTVLATRFSFSSFWHWTVEGLLPLVRMDEAGVLAQLDTVIVCTGGPAPSFIAESLHALGIDDGRTMITDEPFDLAVTNLVLPRRAPGLGGMTDEDEPDDIREVYRRMAEYPIDPMIAVARRRFGVDGPVPGPRRRLLISRRDAVDRRLVNEDDVVASLVPLGFETLVLSDLPFTEKVAAFASADLVVGPHGSGLTNVIWMAPHTRLLELCHDDDHRPHFADLAAVVGVDHTRLPCPPDPTEPRDLHADVDAVLDWVCAPPDRVPEH